MKKLPVVVFVAVLLYGGAVIAYDKCQFGGAVWCSAQQLERRLP